MTTGKDFDDAVRGAKRQSAGIFLLGLLALLCLPSPGSLIALLVGIWGASALSSANDRVDGLVSRLRDAQDGEAARLLLADAVDAGRLDLDALDPEDRKHLEPLIRQEGDRQSRLAAAAARAAADALGAASRIVRRGDASARSKIEKAERLVAEAREELARS